jgi:hypothetical protein
MTGCSQSRFGFTAHFSRLVVAGFDGGSITTDGGGLLLRETDRPLNSDGVNRKRLVNLVNRSSCCACRRCIVVP